MMRIATLFGFIAVILGTAYHQVYPNSLNQSDSSKIQLPPMLIPPTYPLESANIVRETASPDLIYYCTQPFCPKDKCGVADQGNCYCDSYCELNKDCCIGYETCKEYPANAEYIEQFREYMVCSRNIAEITVSSCPKDATNRFADACAFATGNESQIGSVYSLLPVTNGGVHFRNVYCAQCHNVGMSKTQFWSVKDCSGTNIGPLNVRSILKNMFREQLGPERPCHFTPVLPDGYEHSPFVRSCGPEVKTPLSFSDDFGLIDSCSDWNSNSSSHKEVEEKCHVHTAYVYGLILREYPDKVALELQRYKNVFCARCNDRDDSDFKCPMVKGKLKPRPTKLPQTSESLDTIMRFPKTITCKDGEIIDDFTKECRPLLRCGISHVEWEGSCIRDPFDHGYVLPERIPEDSTTKPWGVLTVMMRLTLGPPLTLILTKRELNDTSFLGDSFKDALDLVGYRMDNLNINATLGDVNVTKTQMVGGQELRLGGGAEFVISFFRSFIPRSFPNPGKISNLHYLRKMVRSLEKLAESRARFDLDFTVFSQGVVVPLTCQEGLMVTIPYNETLQRYFAQKGREVNDVILKSSSTNSIDIIACDKYAVKFNNCDILTYNLTSILEARKAISEPYVIINEKVFVCIRQAMTSLLFKSSVSPIVTQVGITFSLFFLALTLVLHIMLKALRTLPGLMLMNLCGVLFIAQMLFITAVNRVTDNTACSAVAIVNHYFWLSTFFWMNAIAANMAWTFTRGFLDAGNAGNRRLIFASSYAYGSPMVIILICGLLDKLSGARIGYGPKQGEQGPCWFTERDGLLYAFVLPLGLIVTANLCLFVITTVYIAKAKQLAKAATGKDSKADIVLYVKLSLLMGFTWIFGFIGTFTDNTIIWHLFVILNSSLGMFISLAFSFNKRTLVLLQRLFNKDITTGLSSTQKTKLSIVQVSTNRTKGKEGFNAI